jgi:hypothetical protein
MTVKPLNPKLYNTLKRVFNEVKIANEGQGFIAKVITPALRSEGRKKRVEILQAGEYYQVCCPFCKDSRFRLWFNHRWDSKFKGQSLLHLVVCYNEHCEQDSDNFKKLLNMVRDNRSLGSYVIRQGYEAKLEHTDFPGKCVSIKDIDKSHPVYNYLVSTRHFSASELDEDWDIRLCTESSVLPKNRRIIIPIYGYSNDFDFGLLGWQARWFNADLNSDKPPFKHIPKYRTSRGTKKSRLLYNEYRASLNKDIVVICEGPFDAIRVGKTHSVAVLGKNVSFKQKDILWNKWGKYGATAVLALDPDAEDELNKLYDEMSETWNRVIKLNFDTSKDAGSVSRNEIWLQIMRKINNENTAST